MHYIKHLSRDLQLKKLISAQGPMKLEKQGPVCYLLCASIMSQQLATPVARTIKRRFLDLFNGSIPTPDQILETKHQTLRSIGLSNAKASYIHNAARFAIEKGMDARALARMSDEEVIDYLTDIKGVGRWTAEMLLMFTLGREDVFAIGDGGLRNAVKKLYRLRPSSEKALDKRMAVISEKWRPYRSYACMHLWRYKDAPTGASKKSGRK